MNEENKDYTIKREQSFDKKYKLPDGTLFTYMMYTDLCIYYDFIEDLHEKYGTSCIRELREKLGVK